MFKKISCPLSKVIIKIALVSPFILMPVSIMLLLSDIPYIKENFQDIWILTSALPVSAIIVALLGDLVWKDKFKD
jgi:hypothetical protein